MRQYATAAELAAYPGGSVVPAENADALLQQASRLVDVLLRGVVYDTGSDGLPTDTDVAEALQTAACAQATLLNTLGGIGARDAETQQWSNVKIGSVQLSGVMAGAGPASGVEVDGVPIATDAVLTLQAANLANPTVLRR